MANKTVGKKPTGYLQPLYESEVGELVELCGSKIIIGRHPKCDIHIPDNNISRIHCVLKHDSRGWWIIDKESVNGTYIHEVRIKAKTPTLLKDGHLIFLGPPSEIPHVFRYTDSPPSNRNIFIYRGKTKFMQNSALSGNENSSVMLGNTDDESKKCEVIVSKSLQCSERKSAIPEMPECSSNRVNFNESNQDCKINDDHNENGECSLSDSCSSDSSMASLESLQTRIRRKIASKQRSKQLGDGQGTSSSVPRKKKKKNNKDLEPGNLIGLNLNIPATSRTEKPLQEDQKDENESVEVHKNHTHTKAEIITDSERQRQRQGLLEESEDSQSLLTENCIMFDFDSYPFSQEIPQLHEVPETKTVISASDGMHPENQKWNPEAYEKIIAFFQSKLNECEKTNLALEKSLKEANVKLITEEVRQNLNQDFRKKLEDLHCTICTELCIKTVVLNCSHSFCKYCITEWKKKKKQCPICRERITTETHVLALDHFIEKVTDLLSKEELERRKELIESREKSKAQTTSRTRAQRRGRGRRQPRQHERSSSVEFVMEMDGIIAMASQDGVIAMASEESDSDSSVEGLSYYPGYGRCFNCGRRGHWANGCPLR